MSFGHTEGAGLSFIREKEKLALDVYLTLYDMGVFHLLWNLVECCV